MKKQVEIVTCDVCGMQHQPVSGLGDGSSFEVIAGLCRLVYKESRTGHPLPPGSCGAGLDLCADCRNAIAATLASCADRNRTTSFLDIPLHRALVIFIQSPDHERFNLVSEDPDENFTAPEDGDWCLLPSGQIVQHDGHELHLSEWGGCALILTPKIAKSKAKKSSHGPWLAQAMLIAQKAGIFVDWESRGSASNPRFRRPKIGEWYVDRDGYVQEFEEGDSIVTEIWDGMRLIVQRKKKSNFDLPESEVGVRPTPFRGTV